MTATVAWIGHDSFWFEARRICDERELEPDSLEKIAHALRWRAYQDAIQPYIRLKCRLFNFKMPKYILHADGRSETIVEWTEDEKATLAQIDELIAAEAKRYGLAPQEGLDQ
jgi:hypothetical protein